MPMDKSWINIKNQKSLAFMNGVKEFVEYAANFVDSNGKVRCPCKKCVTMTFERISVVRAHILQNGFHQLYTNGFSSVSRFKIQYMKSLQLRRMWTK